MKRIQLIAAMSLAVLLAASAFAQERIVRQPDDPLEVRVWTNKAEGKSFGQGEHIIIYFRANRDCFVTIYDLDTRGNVNLLFPYDYNDPIYVEGGRVYTIPDYYDEYKFVVDGPPGTEYIQAVASLDPFDVPSWPSRFFEYDDYYLLQMDREPVEFLHYVNSRYFPLDNCANRCATDYTTIEVRRDWSYDWDDYYDVTHVYHHHYYDPWDWCGSVYIGYPYGASIWIDGIFYGYAPCFVPRIVVGWHHVRIWYSDYDWYYGRFNIHPGCWYDYTYDDIRYKDSPKHYGFKPKRRGSPRHVADNYHPDRRQTVYTREAGYVTRDVYQQKYARKTTVKRPGRSNYGLSGSAVDEDHSYSRKGREGANPDDRSAKVQSTRKKSSWDEYYNPKVKSGSGRSSKEPPRSSGLKVKGTTPKSKSPGYSKPKSGSSKESPRISKPKSSGSSGKSPGYSKPRSTPKSPSGSGSKKSGDSKSGGSKKGGGKRR